MIKANIKKILSLSNTEKEKKRKSYQSSTMIKKGFRMTK